MFDYYTTDHGAAEKVPYSRVNMGCVELAAGLTCNYPQGTVLKKGMNWTIPKASSYYGIEFPCKIVGLAEVAGRETVEIVSERRIDEPEPESPGTARTQTYYITYYVELSTGITVRQEYRTIIHRPATPEKDQAAYTFNQVLESQRTRKTGNGRSGSAGVNVWASEKGLQLSRA